MDVARGGWTVAALLSSGTIVDWPDTPVSEVASEIGGPRCASGTLVRRRTIGLAQPVCGPRRGRANTAPGRHGVPRRGSR